MTWERARMAQHCGACGGTIAIGAPIQVLTKYRKVRCDGCATEPAPDLPALDLEPVPRVLRTPIQPMLAVASLARDWKASALAEREPGEDG